MNNLFNVQAELKEIRRLQKTKAGKQIAKQVSRIPCTGPSVADVFAMMNGVPTPVGWERCFPWYRKRKRRRNYYLYLPINHPIILHKFRGRKINQRTH